MVDTNDLTKIEEDVLNLIADENLTVKQASIRRQTSVQAIYKIRKRLIKKGVLNLVNKRVENKGGCSKPQKFKIRLHNEQYHIKPAWLGEKYLKKVSSGSVKLMLDGNSVMLHRNSIDVYSNRSFYGDTPSEADSHSMRYWKRFFNNLEYDLKCILVQERKENIVRSRCEYAEIGNELARQCLREHDKIRVIGEDGKVWLLVDNSFNFNEMETTHSKRSKEDMENIVQPFFNDLRNNELVTMSELKNIIKDLTNGIHANALTLQALMKLNLPPEEIKRNPEETNKKVSSYIG